MSFNHGYTLRALEEKGSRFQPVPHSDETAEETAGIIHETKKENREWAFGFGSRKGTGVPSSFPERVVDISDLLCDHLNSINYGALHEIYPVESRPNGIKWGGCNVALENSVCKKFSSRRKRKKIANSSSDGQLVLATGSCDGSVKIWSGNVGRLLQHAEVDNNCFSLIAEDNSIRGWILHGNALYEASLPSKFPTSDDSSNLSRVPDLCFGLALSPGELMLAVVPEGVIEFFWTGGQSLEVANRKNLDCCKFDSLTDAELTYWENNILRSLKCFENVNKPVVVWDLITLLVAFRKALPHFVDNILTKWISSWFAYPLNGSIEEMFFDDQEILMMISSRKIELLSIICRRVLLSDADLQNHELHKSIKFHNKEEVHDHWNKLLIKCERELRARLFWLFTFQAVLNHPDICNETLEDGHWLPLGVAQMKNGLPSILMWLLIFMRFLESKSPTSVAGIMTYASI
ncbi:hypothetical protein HPP92_021257 [Vanilla planifolia]|uniref:Uncharacterized protein n=1 Tax=Vanilla planifolia TaxID=51239 RepID=A0A835UHD7_VANPL|nr:hypothetical protein HPP92_021257 [Vanilla planifolia]